MIAAPPLQWAAGLPRRKSRKAGGFSSQQCGRFPQRLTIEDGIARELQGIGQIGYGCDDIVIDTNRPDGAGWILGISERTHATTCLKHDHWSDCARDKVKLLVWISIHTRGGRCAIGHADGDQPFCYCKSSVEGVCKMGRNFKQTRFKGLCRFGQNSTRHVDLTCCVREMYSQVVGERCEGYEFIDRPYIDLRHIYDASHDRVISTSGFTQLHKLLTDSFNYRVGMSDTRQQTGGMKSCPHQLVTLSATCLTCRNTYRAAKRKKGANCAGPCCRVTCMRSREEQDKQYDRNYDQGCACHHLQHREVALHRDHSMKLPGGILA